MRLICLCLLACTGAPPIDAGPEDHDAGREEQDAGRDAGTISIDAGTDAGAIEAPTRGMYASLYSDGVGTIEFGGDTEHHRFILGDAAKEAALLSFASEHGIRSLALYDMYPILGDAGRRAALVSFMSRARAMGILRIEAIGGVGLETWDRIAAFHRDDARFDGLVTEIEFWNESATLAQLTAVLDHVEPLAIPITVYVGWVEASDVQAIAHRIDRVYVHAYVNDPSTAWGYVDDRVLMFQAASPALEIWPIYSAEDTEHAAGSEHFMGEWLRDHSIEEAEATFMADYEASGATIAITGHQFYDYFFLERYLP
jgi:hypothetical protein